MAVTVPVRPSRPANLRDVGGLRTTDGYVVRRGVLFRGDAPQPGDPRSAHRVGLDASTTWPPATVVDLRSAAEAGPRHPFDDVACVHHVPLGASLAPDRIPASTEPFDLTWAYRRLADEAGPDLARIVGVLATAPGPLLVHCVAGKDRTGLVVATVLTVLGVPRETVVADYLRTNDVLDALWARLRAAGVPEPRHEALLGVEAAALHAVLDDLQAWPGGAAGRLRAAGVDDGTLRSLAERLLLPDTA